MSNLIAALLAWLFPARGRRRAVAPVPAQRTAPSALPNHRSPRPAAVIESDDLPLVPLYLVHHERAEEARRQRERRRALALAALGQDMPGAAA